MKEADLRSLPIGSRLFRLCCSLVLAVSMVPIAPAAAFADDGNASASGALTAGSSAVLTTMDASALDRDADVWDGAIDTAWYDASQTTFTLSKPAQLAGLAAIVNGTAVVNDTETPIARDDFSGKTVKLANDIVLNASAAAAANADGQQVWTGIGAGQLTTIKDGVEGANSMPSFDPSVYFNGTFDGQGHAVKNIYIYKPTETAVDGSTGQTYGGYQGLFTALGSNAVVKNVGVDGGYIYGRVAGGIAAISHAGLTDDSMPHIVGCYNTATIQGNGASTRGIGGIFGGEEQYRPDDGFYRGAAYIANCYNAGAIKGNSGEPAGGIAGTGSVHMYSCYNTGTVTSGSAVSNYAGALAGNLIGADKVVNNSDTVRGSSIVKNSYALSGCIGADYHGTTKLFNLVTGELTIDSAEAAVTEDETNALAFKDATWFASADARDALSHYSFATASPSPKLWWQGGDVADLLDLEEEENYSYGYVYEVWGIRDRAYTGQAITPPVVLSTYDWSTEKDVMLREGADYTYSYSNNVDPGTATISIAGFGRFTGHRTATFKIVNGDLTEATIDNIPAQWVYGTTPVTPSVTVRSSDGTTLTEYDEDTKKGDYKLEYANNDKAGTATVTVKPATDDSAFSGSVSAEFQLVAASGSLDGAGTEQDPWKLSSKADWQFLAHEINSKTKITSSWSGTTVNCTSTYVDDYFKVTDSFNMAATKSEPLAADWLVTFGGTIDGDGNTITVSFTDESPSSDIEEVNNAIALVDLATNGATFKNLTIDGRVTSPRSAAGFVGGIGSGTLTFDSCTNKAAVSGKQFYSGGAAGFVYQTGGSATVVMTDCTNAGDISSEEATAAGFISRQASSATFTRCANTGAITSGKEDAGGFVATLTDKASYDGGATYDVSFLQCRNKGVVTSTSNNTAGGFIGQTKNKLKSLTFAKSYNAGTVNGVTQSAGFIGMLSSPASITNCYNVGDIQTHVGNSGSLAGNRPPAGFVGEFNSSSAAELSITNAYTAGNIMALGEDSPRVAFVGQLFYNTPIVVLDNVYYDSATADSAIGVYGFYSSASQVTDGSEVQSTDVMTGSAFIAMLGAAFSADGDAENGGYPILADRTVSEIDACTFSPASIPDQQYTGADIKPAITVTDTNSEKLTEGVDYMVFYTVDGSQGTATVMGIGDWTGTKTLTFNVKKCSISNCAVSPMVTRAYADNPGGSFTQDIIVTNPAGKPMVEGTDYLVSYSGNDRAGTAMVMITGKGDYYEGTALKMFAITPGDFTACTVEGMKNHYDYDYYGLSVSASVTAKNGYKLTASSYNNAGDYKITYKDAEGNEVSRSNLKPGTATAVFTGSGNWIGQQSFDFTYGKNLATDAVVANGDAVVQHTGDAIDYTPQLTYTYVDWYDNEATGTVDAAEYAVAIADANGNTVDAANVKDPGVYTYTMTSNGLTGYGKEGWYGSTTTTLTVATPGFFIGEDAVSGVEAEYVETGEAVIPSPTVTVNGSALAAGSEYTVTFTNADSEEVATPTAAGTYTVTVQGVDPYVGKVVKQFEIVKPHFTVYKQTGSDVSTLTKVKAYTKSQFDALVPASEQDPISALLWNDGWSVATATEYVSLEDLFVDAGLVSEWKSGASINYGGDPAQDKDATTVSYDAIAEAKFFPKAAGKESNPEGGSKTGFVIATKCAGGKAAATSSTKDAEAVQADNVKNASADKCPRTIFGVPEAAYLDPTNNVSVVRGQRLWQSTEAITLVTEEPAKSIAGATVTTSPTSYTYDGTAKEPAVTVKLGDVTLAAGTDYDVAYANNTNPGTATVTVTGKGKYADSAKATFTIEKADADKAHSVSYRTHVQNEGWQKPVADGETSGTSGKSLRLEGIELSLGDTAYAGGIEYRTHIQNIGWESTWKANGTMSGTSGRALRLEAIQIKLTGEMASHYDVYYRVHAQNIGWMGWARNGASAGTEGFGYRLEAIQVKLVEKGGAVPDGGTTSGAFRNASGDLSGVPDAESRVLYRTHVQNVGWQNFMRDDEMAGTSGQSLRLEGIEMKLGGAVSGGIKYRTHIQNVGWQGWKENGAMSGTSGQSLRLEAIQVELTGAAANDYDVYYRVHAQNVGWMGWAKNGEQAGTAGYAYRLEGINVVLVPKGDPAPGPTSNAFMKR